MQKLFIALGIILSITYGVNAQETWKVYKNEKYGFEFSYPGDWEFPYKEATHSSEEEFSFAMTPSSEVLQRTGQGFPPSIGIMGKNISNTGKDWEVVAMSYFQDESEGAIFKKPEKVNFKGGSALKGVKMIPIEPGAYVHIIFFPSQDGKWVLEIVLQKFNDKEDYFNETYNKILDSFKWLKP